MFTASQEMGDIMRGRIGFACKKKDNGGPCNWKSLVENRVDQGIHVHRLESMAW